MRASPLVVRPDLSLRAGLSKSALTSFDLCQQQAWFDLHERRPLIVTERIHFGSCLDAAVEQIATALRAGMTVPMARVMAAVDEVLAREDVGVDRDEIERAAERFMVEVAPHHDFAFCRTQPEINDEWDDLGAVTGHPDFVLANNDVFDCKSAKRAKPEEPTVELGWYALLVEAETHRPVDQVGYWTWVRVARPYWQRLAFPVTDELRRWTRERAGAYVRARKADEALNRKATKPQNYSFPGAAKFASLCADCAYNPANGGPCQMAYREEPAA